MEDQLFTGNLQNPILGKIRAIMMSTERQRLVLSAIGDSLDETLKFMSQHRLSFTMNLVLSNARCLNEEICWAIDAIKGARSGKRGHPGVRQSTSSLVDSIICSPTFSQSLDYARTLLVTYYVESGATRDVPPMFFNEVGHKLKCLTIEKIGAANPELPCKILQERRDIEDVFDTETNFLTEMKFRR